MIEKRSGQQHRTACSSWVLFAAERTLLAWSRTSLTLRTFGFVVEGFGLFVLMLFARPSGALLRDLFLLDGVQSR